MWIDPLSRALFRRYVEPEGDPAARRSAAGELEGYVSIALNGLLFLVKAGLGIASGSISLLADAVHSLSDSGTSLVVVVSSVVSRRPPDREHPFGHQRAESIGAVLVAMLLGVAAVEFGRSSVERLLEPRIPEVPLWAVVAVAFTIPVKQWLGMFSVFLGRKTDSASLHGEAWHHFSDVASTGLVVVALMAARQGWGWVDGVMGLGISVLLLWAAWNVAREAVDPLLGSAPDSQDVDRIRRRAASVEGVRGVHDIVVHRYGDRRVVTLHVETCHRLTAQQSHTIAEQVERRVGDHGMVVVHVDPVDRGHPMHATLLARTERFVAEEDRLDGFHDLRVGTVEKRPFLEVDFTPLRPLSPAERREIRTAYARYLDFEDPDAWRIVIEYEPLFAFSPDSRVGREE